MACLRKHPTPLGGPPAPAGPESSTDAKADRLRPDCALPHHLHRARQNRSGKPMDAELRHQPVRRRIVLDHLRSGAGLALLPVFVGFDVLFPFTELRPKKYQLSSRF
ncbi:hypothetical protein IE4803_CH03127 [Rhizobium etli bv. phaseoli str. IE4803]|nr:hypothetical protein IE4803_CH03127 [Rhizobium etli bv. phaseoli str. IE4803]ARQ59148.1 hypothetical protein Kim5_CH03115 [Rhizobium sp. Kim5]